MVDYLPKWHRIDELVQLVQFVGVQRPRYKAGTSYSVIWVDVPLMDISSSMVRSFIKDGCRILWCLMKFWTISKKRDFTNDCRDLTFDRQALWKIRATMKPARFQHVLGVEQRAYLGRPIRL